MLSSHLLRRTVAFGFVVFSAVPAFGQRQDTLRLTIRSAVEQALTASDEVRITQAQIELADAQVTAARAAGIPQARLTSTYSHAYENARANAVGSVFNQPNTYNTSTNLSQSLFQGGRIMAGKLAAESTREDVPVPHLKP